MAGVLGLISGKQMQKRSWLALLLIFWVAVGQAQELSVEYGPAVVPIDQYFTITLTSSPNRPTKVEGFPEIEGLQKSTQKTARSVYQTGADRKVVYSLTQQYAPLREGDITVKPFSLTVDGVTVSSPGLKGKVVEELAPGQASPDTLGANMGPVNNPAFVDVKENAFLTLHVPKSRVYVGEGVPLSLWFYVADSDLGLVDFHNFEPQILEIIRQLKQPSVLEEVVDQTEILPEKVKVADKDFTRYKLYEALLFPITAQDLQFPAVRLQMIKYKVAKSPSLLTQNRLPEYKTYSAQEKKVTVRQLPPHPLRDQVAVGVFRLREQVSKSAISLNQNLVYQMQMEGEGNISKLPLPQSLGTSSELEIYPPEVRQVSTISQGRNTGAKTFRYFVVGRQAGVYPLRELFQWVYFNPVTARYDTLRPTVTVRVRGREDQNLFIRAQDVGSFYNIIATESNELRALDQFKEVRLYANVVLATMAAVALFIFILKRNE